MKKMKTLFAAPILVLFFLFSSCNDDNDGWWYYNGYKSLVTVKVEGDSFYFVSDKGSILQPVNSSKWYSPEKDERAFIYFNVDQNHPKDKDADYAINVYAIDPILSKNIAENLYEENEKEYGDDPVRVERMWVGGGFLNLKFSTYWGGKTTHYVNLVQEDDDDPYTLRFRHNAYDDPKFRWGYGWVAFDLSTLPRTTTDDGKIEIKVKVQTYGSLNEYTFKFKPGEEDPENTIDFEETEEQEAMGFQIN